MINLSKESLELLLVCLNNNPPSEEFIINGPTPTAKITDPVKYREEIIEKLLNPEFNDYSPAFYNTLRLVVTNEFCSSGLCDDSEPNEYGLRLDKLNEEIANLFMWLNSIQN